MRRILLTMVVLSLWQAGALAEELTLEAINSASFATPNDNSGEGPEPFIVRVQILLDRANISPGAIDGIRGENLMKAVRSYAEREGLKTDGEVDEELWANLQKDNAPVLETYELTDADLDGRYVDEIPEDYAEAAKLKWLGFRGPSEMLAERFHMDEDLLKTLNPDANWTETGTAIMVASTGPNVEGKVTRIIIDRADGKLIAYDENGDMIVAYPATIGSDENPTPSGEHKVKTAVTEPTYTYNPDVNFQQGENTELLELPAGPNGPVGLVWIDLSKPTYGIHGTPEPDVVGKTPSHGCVRLTNWDALELADLVEAGSAVEFK